MDDEYEDDPEAEGRKALVGQWRVGLVKGQQEGEIAFVIDIGYRRAAEGGGWEEEVTKAALCFPIEGGAELVNDIVALYEDAGLGGYEDE